MPLIATRGASSVQGFGQFAQATAANYIEDVFSTYLYTGTGASQTITNNIDLSTKGGMVWIKSRSDAVPLDLFDTARGAGRILQSTLTAAQVYTTDTQKTLTSFNTDGFSLGDDAGAWGANSNGYTFASWTFRKQPKFFDIQTWTGSGANRTISHSLGSVPGSIIVKRTDTTGAWQVYHRSLANTEYLVLNTNAAKATGATRWNSTTPTSSVFSLGTDATVNASGGTYVAYIFAHDAGGFGLTGTDNVISCGSYTGTSATGNAQTLGYEPQWILIKNITTASYDWTVIDTMRGWATNGADAELYANSSSAEYFADNLIDVTATGFNFSVSGATALNTSGNTYIYIACRRGPMKVPTTGTSVFAPITYTGTNVDNRLVNTGIVTDMTMARIRTTSSTGSFYTADRLRGNASLGTVITDAEDTDPDSFMTPTVGYGNSFSAMNGFGVGNDATRKLNQSSTQQLAHAFRRAPSFFDVVCYTGTGSATTFSHNLQAVPELMIVKQRDGTAVWRVYNQTSGNGQILNLSGTAGDSSTTVWNNTTPTASVFSVGTSVPVNGSNNTYVAYLFATCAGVSKVGSYTGTGTTLQVNCGFTTGARFVLIKRTDSTGGWYVWDTARGIISGNDPYLFLDSTADEVTNTDYIDTYNAGFELSSTAPAAINASGGTHIFLAIA